MPHTPEQKKQHRKAKDAAAGIVRREYTRTGLDGLFADSPRNWRLEYKRQQRIKAGAKSRADIVAVAQAKREAKAQIKLQQQEAEKHDCHVRRYMRALADRAKYAKRYAENTIAERERTSLHKQKLPDSYVRQQLVYFGIPKEVITPELIELMRQAMDARRISKTIKRAIKDHWKEENETITKHT